MGMFLKHLRRKGRSTVGGTLRCPACDVEERDPLTRKKPVKRPRLKFLHTVGSEQDIYQCRKCNRIVRYMTTPHCPMSHGMDREDAIKDAHRGLHHKERARLDKIKRARKRNINWLPGLGKIAKDVPGKKKPKD